MRQKTVFVILSWLSASAFLLGQALAQAPPAGQAQAAAAQAPPCMPSPQAGGARGQGPAGQDQQGRGQAAQQAPRNLTVTAIPGVVAAEPLFDPAGDRIRG